MSKLFPDGVSVVVCCYNSATRLPETLRHLARQTVPSATPWEVLVINNASTDETAAVAERVWQDCGKPSPLRVIAEPRAGKSFALDTGYAEARYEVLVTVDDDNWLDHDYLANAHQTMSANERIGIIGAQSTARCEIPPPSWFDHMKPYMAVGKPAPSSGDITDGRPYVAGAGMVLRKSAFHELKRRGFSFVVPGPTRGKTGSEDTELCYAIALMGYRTWYDERLHFVHFVPANRLTSDYIIKLNAQKNSATAALMVYEGAWRTPGASATSIYCRRLGKDLQWTWNAFKGLLLGRYSFLVFKLESKAIIKCIVCLPEFLDIYRRHFAQLEKLGDPRAPTQAVDGIKP